MVKPVAQTGRIRTLIHPGPISNGEATIVNRSRNSHMQHSSRTRQPLLSIHTATYLLFLVGISYFCSLVILGSVGVWSEESAIWNWERLLPFVHLNRLAEGQTIFNIRLQRLPGLIPVYPIFDILQRLAVLNPYQRSALAIINNYACLILLRASLLSWCIGRKKLLAINIFVVTFVELILIESLKIYRQFALQAARLNHHGDSTLINILLTLLCLVIWIDLISQSEKPYQRTSRVLTVTLCLMSFLGSLTSSLYVIQILFPFFLIWTCSFIPSLTRVVSKNDVIERIQKLALPLLLSGLAGLGFLKLFLNSGCTPGFSANAQNRDFLFSWLDPARGSLFFFDSQLGLSFISAFLLIGLLAYQKYNRKDNLSNPKLTTPIIYKSSILALPFISLAPTVLISIITSYGVDNTYQRYGLYFVLCLPIVIGIYLYSLHELSRVALKKKILNGKLVFFCFLLLMFFSQTSKISKAFDFDAMSKYRNHTIRALDQALADIENKYPGQISSSSSVSILSTGCTNDPDLDPAVIEFLSNGKYRSSLLAGSVDPRLFDQNAAEYLITPSEENLAKDNIREFPIVISDQKCVQKVKATFGTPTQEYSLAAFSEQDNKHKLLFFDVHSRLLMKNHFSSYLKSNIDYYRHNEFCNMGDGFFASIASLFIRP
jgi:hypothetical protein